MLLGAFYSEIRVLLENGETVVLGIRVLVYLHGVFVVVWWLADAPRSVTLFCNECSLKLL